VANFFLYQQNRDINTMRTIEKNSYRLWQEKETAEKRIYKTLYEKTRKERNLYYVQYYRTKEFISKNFKINNNK
jgi:hypothetical protein